MTIDEHLAAIAATLHALAEAQLRTQTATEGLVRAQTQTQETIGSMATSIGKYVDAADARMKRLEENSTASYAPSPPSTPTARANTNKRAERLPRGRHGLKPG